jgi:hypothetical protein
MLVAEGDGVTGVATAVDAGIEADIELGSIVVLHCKRAGLAFAATPR